jgi:cell wall assembly regulator SMI1
MDKIWKRIEAWLKQNAPDTLAYLQPGASDADIKKAARSLSCELPDDVTESYHIHDGMRGAAGSLIGEWSLMPLAIVVREWKTLKKLSDGGTFEGMEGDADVQVKSDWWNPRWIPVASNGSGDFVCVDLDPPRTGKSGQVISFFHAEPRRELLAKSFKSWLAGFADDLKAGK